MGGTFAPLLLPSATVVGAGLGTRARRERARGAMTTTIALIDGAQSRLQPELVAKLNDAACADPSHVRMLTLVPRDWLNSQLPPCLSPQNATQRPAEIQ